MENRKKKIIVAQFLGKDSVGYQHGETYTLALRENRITRIDGSGACRYGSVQAFLNNWFIKQS